MAVLNELDQKSCADCGGTLDFKRRTRVPGTGIMATGDGGALPEPQYTAAWSCENVGCDYFEAVNGPQE